MTDLIAQLEEANTALTTAQADLASASASLSEAQNQIAALTETNTELEADVARLSTELDEAVAELTAAGADLEAMTAANAALTEANEALTASNTALTAANAELEANVTDLTARLEQTTAELTAAQATLSETQTAVIELLSQDALAQGFGGNVKVSAVINSQGAIAYLTVDATCETEGLGQKVMETEYLAQFLGKTLPLTLGEDVDAVSGATVTSQAVVDALNLLATDYDNVRSAESVVNQGSVTKMLACVQTIKGYESNLKVVVYTTPEGVVTAVNVYAEGESKGQEVMANAFTNQFVGCSETVTLGEDVDAVTGATATSQAVVDAVNNVIK